MKKIIFVTLITLLFSCNQKKQGSSNKVHTKTQTVTFNIVDKTTQRNKATFGILKDLDFTVEFHPYADTSNFVAYSQLNRSRKKNLINETYLYIVDQNEKMIQFKSSIHFKNFMAKKGYNFKDAKTSLTFSTYHFIKNNK